MYRTQDLKYSYKKVNGVTRVEVSTPDERRIDQEDRVSINRNQVIAVTVMTLAIAGLFIYNVVTHGWTSW